MNDIIPDKIRKDLTNVYLLHGQAVSDFAQCVEFNKLMFKLLARLEDAHCYKTADKVMSVLLVCNPKKGARCEKYSGIAKTIEKLKIF